MTFQVTIAGDMSAGPDESETIDSVIITLPGSVYAAADGTRALDAGVLRAVLREATRDSCRAKGRQLHHAMWTITGDPEEMRTLVMTDDCPTCQAGADRTQAYLRQHPGRQVAVGQLWWAQ